MVGCLAVGCNNFLSYSLHLASSLAATEQDSSSLYGPICSCASTCFSVYQRIPNAEAVLLNVATFCCLDGNR